MDYLIELSVNTNEELNIALHKVNNILRTLEPLCLSTSIKKKDIIRNKIILFLKKLIGYLKTKSYHIRRWNTYFKSEQKEVDNNGFPYLRIEWLTIKELRPSVYENDKNKIGWLRNKILEEHNNINNFQD